MYLQTCLARESAPVSQPRVIQLAVVTGLGVVLWFGLHLVDEWHGLLKQRPPVFERTLVHVDHFIELWINRIFQLSNDRAIVNARGDFMNCQAVLDLAVFQGPVDRRDASVLGQWGVV